MNAATSGMDGEMEARGRLPVRSHPGRKGIAQDVVAGYDARWKLTRGEIEARRLPGARGHLEDEMYFCCAAQLPHQAQRRLEQGGMGVIENSHARIKGRMRDRTQRMNVSLAPGPAFHSASVNARPFQ